MKVMLTKLTNEQKELLASLRIYPSLKKEAELVRRLNDNLPLLRDYTVEGSKDIFEWQPGDLRPFWEGEEIVWKG